MRLNLIAAVSMCVAAAVAGAKLPAPTPEQQEAAAAKKEQEKVALEKEKVLLERAQDRTAEYYKKTKGASASAASSKGAGGRTSDTNISKKAVEGPGQAGAGGGTKQSAEAHSTPAK